MTIKMKYFQANDNDHTEQISTRTTALNEGYLRTVLRTGALMSLAFVGGFVATTYLGHGAENTVGDVQDSSIGFTSVTGKCYKPHCMRTKSSNACINNRVTGCISTGETAIFYCNSGQALGSSKCNSSLVPKIQAKLDAGQNPGGDELSRTYDA